MSDLFAGATITHSDFRVPTFSSVTGWVGGFEKVRLHQTEQLPRILDWQYNSSHDNSAPFRFSSTIDVFETQLREAHDREGIIRQHRHWPVGKNVVQGIGIDRLQIGHGVLLFGVILRFRRAFHAFVNEWRASEKMRRAA